MLALSSPLIKYTWPTVAHGPPRDAAKEREGQVSVQPEQREQIATLESALAAAHARLEQLQRESNDDRAMWECSREAMLHLASATRQRWQRRCAWAVGIGALGWLLSIVGGLLVRTGVL